MNKKILIGLLWCGFFMQSSVDATKSRSSDCNMLPIFGGVTAVVAVTSLVQGIYNVRKYNQIIAQCKLDYHLSNYIPVYEYPSQAMQNLICIKSQDLDQSYSTHHGLCMTEIAKKIYIFDTMNNQAIWNFEIFKDTIPHTNFQSAYCISKSYLASFGYVDLGSLKSAISDHIFKIKDDFKNLLGLTNLSWSYVPMPKNIEEFDGFKNLLSSSHNCYGAYAFLGVFGYSSLHNSQSIKDCLISMVKIHAFLINFQELLTTCVDYDDTQLINAQGLLNFSIQHVHQIQKRL